MKKINATMEKLRKWLNPLQLIGRLFMFLCMFIQLCGAAWAELEWIQTPEFEKPQTTFAMFYTNVHKEPRFDAEIRGGLRKSQIERGVAVKDVTVVQAYFLRDGYDVIDGWWRINATADNVVGWVEFGSLGLAYSSFIKDSFMDDVKPAQNGPGIDEGSTLAKIAGYWGHFSDDGNRFSDGYHFTGDLKGEWITGFEGGRYFEKYEIIASHDGKGPAIKITWPKIDEDEILDLGEEGVKFLNIRPLTPDRLMIGESVYDRRVNIQGIGYGAVEIYDMSGKLDKFFEGKRNISVITGDRVRMRTEHNVNAPIIRHLDKGTVVQTWALVNTGDEKYPWWCEVSIDGEVNGDTGWVYSEFLQE